jgi:hypothetical protein
VDALRADFLRLSLDAGSIVRDVENFSGRRWRIWGESDFQMNYSPHISRRDREQGQEVPPAINFTERLRNEGKSQARMISEADKEYREILSAVISLGATVDTFRIGRIALWVSLVSLIVSGVALGIADIGDHTIIGRVFGW